jgi:hypothetical protein
MSRFLTAGKSDHRLLQPIARCVRLKRETASEDGPFVSTAAEPCRSLLGGADTAAAGGGALSQLLQAEIIATVAYLTVNVGFCGMLGGYGARTSVTCAFSTTAL